MNFKYNIIYLVIFVLIPLLGYADTPILWYNFNGHAPWYECPTAPFPPEATIITAFDQEYQYFGSDNRRQVEAAVNFPTTGTWSQIGLWLHIECPESTLCDHWDRTGSVQLVLNPEDDPVDWEYLELIRHITPYRREMCEYVDVSALAPLLTGTRTIASWIDTWVGPGHSDGEGWRTTVKFVFYPGPPGGADEIINIWGRRSITVGNVDPDYNVDSQIDPVTVKISPYTTKVQARVITTGHGFGYTFNCAEFCQMRQDLYVNGTRYSVNPWRNDCELNPVSPQAGTWKYNRNGWCPGCIVVGKLFDITGDIVIGSDNEIDFDIRLRDGDEYENTVAGGWPHEFISVQLYLYKSRPDIPAVNNTWILLALLSGVCVITLVPVYISLQK